MPLEQRPNRNIGTGDGPGTVGMPKTNVDRQTEVYTYFTVAGMPPGKSTPILYNGDREWAEVTLVLETAGPVAVGTRADLFPVLSGKGELLITNVPMKFTIAKSDRRLYIASTAVSRVKVQIAPYAWAESITSGVNSVQALLTLIQSRR
jgi:hypothetical protein